MSAKKTAKRYTEEEKNAIVEAMKNEGLSAGDAVKRSGMSPAMINNLRKKHGLAKGRSVSENADKISEEAFVKVMAGKGFKYERLVNSITGKVVSEKVDPQIKKLGLVFAPGKANLGKDEIRVTQTSPQIQVTMSFEHLLHLLKIKP